MVESLNQFNVFAGVAKKTGFPEFLVQLSRRPLPPARAMEIPPFSPEGSSEAEHGGNEWRKNQSRSCTGANLMAEVLIAALQDIRMGLVVERFPLHK